MVPSQDVPVAARMGAQYARSEEVQGREQPVALTSHLPLHEASTRGRRPVDTGAV